jgi:hypothetical protein
VSDALLNAVSAQSATYKGQMTMVGSSKTVTTFTGGLAKSGATVNADVVFDSAGKKYTLGANGVLDDKNDLYVKARDIDSLVDNYRRVIPADSQKLFDQIIAKIDDKWIKISSQDLKSYSENVATTQKCSADAAKKIQNDSAARSELISIYKKHPFIAIDKSLGVKDGSLGYALSVNHETSRAFSREYKNSAIYKTLVECDSSFTLNDDDLLQASNSKADGKTQLQVWVSQWGHTITKITANKEARGQMSNISIEPKFNQPVSVVPPKDATTIDQLQKDVQQLLTPAQQS